MNPIQRFGQRQLYKKALIHKLDVKQKLKCFFIIWVFYVVEWVWDYLSISLFNFEQATVLTESLFMINVLAIFKLKT